MMASKAKQCSGVTSARLFLVVMIAACLYRGQIGGAVILAIVFLVLEIFK